jgi:hypothetical protein
VLDFANVSGDRELAWFRQDRRAVTNDLRATAPPRVDRMASSSR